MAVIVCVCCVSSFTNVSGQEGSQGQPYSGHSSSSGFTMQEIELAQQNQQV